MIVAPSGGAVTVSRWLIHTVCCGGSPLKSAPEPSSSSVLPNSEVPGPRDLAAELERHQLGAVADAERGDAELEELLVDSRRPLRVHRRGAAGEDHRDRVAPADLRRAQRVRDELGVDPGIANAARDQLRVLSAEVEHEHRTLLGRGFRGRKRMRSVPITAAGSSANPS